MDIATLNAYERLWKLHDHADLQAYGPDLLITDVETVIASLASAEREIAELRSPPNIIRALISTITELEICEQKYRAEADAICCDGTESCKHCPWLDGATMIGRTIDAARDALMADAFERRTA